MSVTINTEQFSGPINLLLDLIQQNRIDIYNIPIHQITRDFLDVLAQKDVEAEELSEFVLFASMLLEIKSRMLLPDNSLEQMSTHDTDDPRHELMMRLIEYQRIRRIESFLSIRQERFKHHIYSDTLSIELPPPTQVDLRMDPLLIKKAFLNVLHTMDRYQTKDPEFFKRVSLELFSVKEAESRIGVHLEEVDSFIFDDLFKEASHPGEKVASFLALLKMGQRNILNTEQEAQFEPILVKRRYE